MNVNTRKQIVLVLCLVALPGCDGCKTTPNTSDTTPPTFEFTVQNKTKGTTTTHPGGGTVHAAFGDELVVTSCAIDDGGVETITATSNSSWSCRQGNIASQTGPGLVVPETHNLGLDSNGKAWSRYCILRNVTLAFNCTSGFTFSSGAWTTTLSAKNFANLTSSATLTIAVP